jgi:1-acyl-sn-glycerol-3-phosphate acyltransferase
LVLATLRFITCVLFRSNSSGLKARSCWLQLGCRRVLRIFNVEIQAHGPIPSRGLLVSNHLSYLDVLVLSALTPSIFVAKREVGNWPIFGWFARMAGTLFVNRGCRTQVRHLSGELQTVLDQGALVVLFLEGTSSDGRTVLPFKSALLEPARNPSYALSAGSISYQLEHGDVGEEVCYWKDMTFVPHLLNLLSKKCIEARVRFSALQTYQTDRKQVARQLHGEVSKLKTHITALQVLETRQNHFQTVSKTVHG